MTSTSPSFPQIKAQLAAIRKKYPHTRSIAIRSKAKWTGQERQEEGGEVFLIRQCDSPLAMRLALREGGDEVTRVLITDLDDHEIGDDILVRLRPRKLVPIETWQIVRSLFQVRTIDPRITRHRWIADLLLEGIPTEGYRPATTGFLDAESVWSLVLKQVIEFEGGRPDLPALLKWSTDADKVAKYRAASVEFREAAVEWLSETAGAAAATVLHCVACNERPDALPFGLAAGVVFHRLAQGKLDKAAGRLEERYLGGLSPPPVSLDRWSAAATEVVRLQISDNRLKQQLLQRADEILREVGADSYADWSDTSPIGFDLRLAQFGRQLSDLLKAPEPSTEQLESLHATRQSIAQHDRHSRERWQLERVDMALRLVQWRIETATLGPPKSLADAADRQLSDGGFVDWARLVLRAGEPIRELADAYSRLFASVTAIRESQARQFAELLRDWTAIKQSDDWLTPVEEVLERIVAPLAMQQPLLVLVIDGMSVAVFRELMADLLGHEWLLLSEEGKGLRPALAVIPSVTEASRTSLLCGRLIVGDKSNEKVEFAAHPSLRAASRSNSPPILFHKAALRDDDDNTLTLEVRKEIQSTHRQVVGVVINAVDDHLAKSEQLDTRWTRDKIKVLPVLLHEARIAGRTVVLLSDHGHVLDQNAAFRDAEGGERWRMDQGSPAEGELRIQGTRVLLPESHRLIAPWTERVYYGLKKNGYHGGISPQEMVIPIAVLRADNSLPKGWVEAPADWPHWWDVSPPSSKAQPSPLDNLKPPQPKSPPPGLLFPIHDEPEPEQTPSTKPSSETSETSDAGSSGNKTPTAAAQIDWVALLLASPVYAEQKRICGRAALPNDTMAALLRAIDERGGKITSAALARALQFPPTRLRFMLAVAQRLLNVDGFSVLNRDDVSDTITLDRPLLCRQFDMTK